MTGDMAEQITFDLSLLQCVKKLFLIQIIYN